MARWPRRITWKPLMRSQVRAFILCGMADEPTWPGRKPSLASSWPAMRRRVLAKDDGPEAAESSAATTSMSIERG